MHWEAPPWAIDIDPLLTSDPRGNPLCLRESATHAATQSLTVGNSAGWTGQCFDANDASDILHDVGRTLGLARAAFSMPLLLSGFDNNGQRVWQCWTGFRTDPWNGHENWFSKNDPAILQSVFTGWRKLAGSPNRESSTLQPRSTSMHILPDWSWNQDWCLRSPHWRGWQTAGHSPRCRPLRPCQVQLRRRGENCFDRCRDRAATSS